MLCESASEMAWIHVKRRKKSEKCHYKRGNNALGRALLRQPVSLKQIIFVCGQIYIICNVRYEIRNARK